MAHRWTIVATVAAFLVAAVAVGLMTIIVDPMPLLVDPSPNLDFPLGLAGLLAGIWSADRICRFPHTPKRVLGRVALWIMVPLLLSFGLVALGNRVQEELSFRGGGSTEVAVFRVVEKNRSNKRNGRVFHTVSVTPAAGGRTVSLTVDQVTYETLEPVRDCVSVLIEHAPDGASRLLRPLRWRVDCPR